jgi:hypothetical protein
MLTISVTVGAHSLSVGQGLQTFIIFYEEQEPNMRQSEEKV